MKLAHKASQARDDVLRDSRRRMATLSSDSLRLARRHLAISLLACDERKPTRSQSCDLMFHGGNFVAPRTFEQQARARLHRGTI
jgi:hypothetical protein